MRLLAWCLVMFLAVPAAAQTNGNEGAKAVAKAKAAFEYRDFKQVIALLDPWLHPPRLVDQKLRIQAHRLLGVSLHITGKKKQAEGEFARLLELDPKHELDPFVTPPSVVETFAAVREEMRATLDAKDPPPKEDPTPTPVLTVIDLPHPAAALLPFGGPQFLLGKTGWGVLWATVQGIALALNIGSRLRLTLETNDATHDQIRREWTTLQFSALGVLVGAYAASAVQGYLQIQEARSNTLPPPPALPAPTTPVAGWTFSF